MGQGMQISTLPLLESKAVIIERGLVVIERTSVRPKFSDVQRAEIEELSELPFALPDLRFRLLCFGNIHRGPDKFYELARLVQDGMAYNKEVLDGFAGKNNAVVCPIIRLLNFGSFNKFPNGLPVLRMNPINPEFSVQEILTILLAVRSPRPLHLSRLQ